jgi:hypothetical protein
MSLSQGLKMHLKLQSLVREDLIDSLLEKFLLIANSVAQIRLRTSYVFQSMRDIPQRNCDGTQGYQSFCFGPLTPDYCGEVPDAERVDRIVLDSDLCIVDNKYYFIRGGLDLPIIGTQGIFSWLVWVSLSEKNFYRAVDLWKTLGRESEPPYFGWLSTSLPYRPETLNLKAHVYTRPVGERPMINLEPTDHPLAVEQRMGMTPTRAQSLANQALNAWSLRSSNKMMPH